MPDLIKTSPSMYLGKLLVKLGEPGELERDDIVDDITIGNLKSMLSRWFVAQIDDFGNTAMTEAEMYPKRSYKDDAIYLSDSLSFFR